MSGSGSPAWGGAGIADVIYVSNQIPLSQTSFTLPAMPLQLNGLYSLEISLVDLRDPNGGVGLPNILSRTRSIFDFTFLLGTADRN